MTRNATIKNRALLALIVGVAVIAGCSGFVCGFLVASVDEPATVAEVQAVVTPTTAVPTSVPTVAPTRNPDEFSEDALTLRAALAELVSFKDETWFHVFCFAQPWNGWDDHVLAMDSTLAETGISGGDLWSMAADYCFSEGAETDVTRFMWERMDQDWLDIRPIPTPIAALRVDPVRPFADVAAELAECSWNNPAMDELFHDELEYSNSVDELALMFEAALDGGTVTTWDGAINALTVCKRGG